MNTESFKASFLAESIRCGWNYRNTEFSKETHDYGHQIGVAAARWFASLPQRGVLETKSPVSWFDYVLTGIKMKLSEVQQLKKVSDLIEPDEVTTKWEAAAYFPSVTLPEKITKDAFFVWWDKERTTTFPIPAPLPLVNEEDY